jgi:aryl-alcohol dehydrogenase-like predicted oxidoreductase
MVKRTLGRTGLQVSAISLGTVELGMDYGISGTGDHRRPNETEAAMLLNRALDMGVNFIDTARGYGESETVIGRAIGHRRREMVLATKLSVPAHASPSEEEALAAQSIDHSLRTLQTDFIDVLYIHSAALDVIERNNVFEAIKTAQHAGKIGFIAASTYGAAAALAVIAHGGYDCIQIAYNVLDRTLESNVIPAAQRQNIGIVARSVLLKGALTHRYHHLPEGLAPLKQAVAQIENIAARAGIGELPELAYRFALANTSVSSLLVGTSHIAELEAVAHYATLPPLPADVVTQLRQVVLADPTQTNPHLWPPI